MLMKKDLKSLLEIRAEMKRRKPHFKRHDRNKLGRLARSGWRSSVQGHDNKQRNRYAGNEKTPTPGYGSPKEVRGMHPGGLKEIMIHNTSELGGVNAKEFAVRVAGSVGNRKKIGIVEAARKLNFKILNPAYFLKEKKPGKEAKGAEKEKKQGKSEAKGSEKEKKSE